MGGWVRNFGIISAVLTGLAGVYVQVFPSIVIMWFPIGLLLSFLICVPFVSPNKARAIAKEYILNQLKTRPTVVMDKVESDNWTWHVFGTYAGSQAPVPIRVKVHAKCGYAFSLERL